MCSTKSVELGSDPLENMPFWTLTQATEISINQNEIFVRDHVLLGYLCSLKHQNKIQDLSQ